MDNWVKRLAEEYAPQEELPREGKHTKLSVLLSTADVDINKLYKLLATNGFPVLDIRVQDTSIDALPVVAAGKRVITKEAVQVGSDIMVKTPTTLYTVASAVLPAGYVGDVLDVSENRATVRFCTNISVSAMDRSGYSDTLDYFVDTLSIPVTDLQILE